MIKDYGDVYGKVPEKEVGIDAIDVFPTETKGNGLIAKNNLRTGAAQGVGSFKRKVKCKICGFPVDIQKVDHSGGSMDGNGAGGQVIVNSNSPDLAPDQKYNLNAGCPLCFSKNSSKISINEIPTPEPTKQVGF